MKKILIINTGGTFNKVYNPRTGNLDIGKDALADLTKQWLCEIKCIDIIQKDSLDFSQKDREILLQTIAESTYNAIIVVHGTDTMETTAKYLSREIQDKAIVLTGAMIPYSINSIEATANLASAYGYLQALDNRGVYIAMHGTILPHYQITKVPKEGKFKALY